VCQRQSQTSSNRPYEFPPGLLEHNQISGFSGHFNLRDDAASAEAIRLERGKRVTRLSRPGFDLFHMAFDVVIEHFVVIRVCLNFVLEVIFRVRWPHFFVLENHYSSARKNPFITAIRQPVRENLLGRLAEVTYF